MKRLFTYMAVLAMAVACEELYGPEPTPIAPDTAAGVEITVSDVKDSSFVVTVTPSAQASYYSWLVDESPKAAALDSAVLYKVGYESVTQGTAKWTAEAGSTTFTVKGLNPNTTYQVYAVTGSVQGQVGSVANKSVKTSDALKPELEDFKAADGTMTLAFSEPVYPGEGDVTLRVFARKTRNIFEDKEEFVYTVPADSISCNPDGTVVLTFAGELPGGAYFSPCYPEGAFVDSFGNKADALESGFYADEDKDGKEVLAAYGIQGRNDFVPFDLVDTLAVKVFTDPEQVFTVAAVDAELADYGKGKSYVTYSTPGKTVELDLVAKETVLLAPGEKEVLVAMACPEAPAYGATVTFTIAEDAVQDIWGNSNAEVELETLCSFGYTLDDVVGDYDVVAWNNDLENYEVGTMTIKKSDDEEMGNVMITSFMGKTPKTPIYGDFDFDGGVLSLYGWQYLETVDGVNTYFFCYTNDYVNLTMPESGVFSEADDYLGYYFTTGTPDGDDETPTGEWQLYLTFAAQKAETPAPAMTSAPSSVNFVSVLK